MLPSLDLGHFTIQALRMPARPFVYPGSSSFVAAAFLRATARVAPVQVLVQVSQPLLAAYLLRQARDLGAT